MRTDGTPKGTILVAEDEPLLRTIAAEILREAGYEVLEACDGLEALSVLETSDVALLMTDIQMPKLNGYQLVETALLRWPGLKVLLVTGYARESAPAPLSAASLQTLQKPFDIETLPALVAGLIGAA